MKYCRTKDQKLKISYSGGRWWAASAWDLSWDDNETWLLNSEANRFAAYLSGTVVRCIITGTAYPYEGRERAYERILAA